MKRYLRTMAFTLALSCAAGCGFAWNSLQPSQKPAWVFGQPTFGTTLSNGAAYGTGSGTLAFPAGLACGGGHCYLADRSNNRILVFNGTPSQTSSPIAVLGQTDFSSGGCNRGGTATATTLCSPWSLAVAGTRLVVSDASNNRVLIWNTLPTTTGAPADVAVGQADLNSNLANQSNTSGMAPTASTLRFPIGVATFGTQLLVADEGNHRVLIFNNIPTTFNVPADNLVGQHDFVSGTSNRGGAVAGNTLNIPEGITVSSGGSLLIADASNNRVLIFNTIPAVVDVSANAVIGQGSSTTSGSGAGLANLSSPVAVTESLGVVYVADAGNSRVLYFSSIPAVSGVAANTAVAVSCAGTIGPACVTSPGGVTAALGKLFVVDTSNSRMLVYNTPPTSNVSADDVFGQTGFSLGYLNQVQTPNARGIGAAGGLAIWNNWLLIQDPANHRILFWDKSQPGGQAQYVLGQPDFNSGSSNQGLAGPTAQTLSYVGDGGGCLAVDGNTLYACDSANSRILVYNLALLSNNMAASYVLGQPGFTTGTSNQGGAASAATLNQPHSVYVYGGRLYVADTQNHRVLTYNLPITSNDPAAAQVYFQPDFTTVANVTDQQHQGSPAGLYVDANGVVASSLVERVIFTALTSTGLTNALGEFGQANFTTMTVNRGAATSGNNGLNSNSGNVRMVAGYLMMADKNNGRIVTFNGYPSGQMGTNMIADFVIGQFSFSTLTSQPASADGTTFGTLSAPEDMISDGESVYFSERGGARVDKISLSNLSRVLYNN